MFFRMLLIFLSGCAFFVKDTNFVKDTTSRSVSSEGAQILFNYPQIFSKAREALKVDSELSKQVEKLTSETQVIDLLEKKPQLLNVTKDELLKVILAESVIAQDPTKHLRLIPPQGTWGYENLLFYASHPYFKGKKIIPASNLLNVWSQFIASAQKKIILNVYDFDLKIIANQLIEKNKSGVQVTVGIDKNTIEQRPEVKIIFDLLSANGVKVIPVDSVSLNHQKMAAIDWDDLDKAKVLFSSGNLTQSCLGPEGDLVSLPANKRPKESIPNANNILTMKSWLLANLVNHELTKTLDSNFLYRGSQYPTTGSFQITGPGVDPQTLEAYPEQSLVITFSPGGGYKHINKNIIAHFIKNSTGPVRMLQFAYSSEEVSQALFERAQKEFQLKNDFDFKSVGDTPFALQFWSQFLKMSGLDLTTDSANKKSYVELPTNSWFKNLTSDQIKKLRARVRIAPDIYGTHDFKIDEKSYSVTSKIHHKVLSTGPFAIVGTSFNFSEAAENNNEQILIFKDKNLVQFVDGMTLWLWRQSKNSVYEAALSRNKTGLIPPDIAPTALEDHAK